MATLAPGESGKSRVLNSTAFIKEEEVKKGLEVQVGFVSVVFPLHCLVSDWKDRKGTKLAGRVLCIPNSQEEALGSLPVQGGVDSVADAVSGVQHSRVWETTWEKMQAVPEDEGSHLQEKEIKTS